MPKLNVEKLEKKFESLTKSRDSIQNLSGWILHHKHVHQEIAEEWLKAIKKSEIGHRLTLFYLANDVLQHCKKKNAPEYKSSFSDVLEEAVLLSRDSQIKREIKRMIDIWKDRAVYPDDFLKVLTDTVSEEDVAGTSSSSSAAPHSALDLDEDLLMSIDDLVDEAEIKKENQKIEEERLTQAEMVALFKMTKLVSSLRHRDQAHDLSMKAYNSMVELINKLPKLDTLDLDGPDVILADSSMSSSEAKMADYLAKEEKCITVRKKAIKHTEYCQAYYTTQTNEVKEIAHIYKRFEKKLNQVQQKLQEKIEHLSESGTPSFVSPLSDASEDHMKSPFNMPSTIFSQHAKPLQSLAAQPGQYGGGDLSESRLSLDKRLSLMLKSRNLSLPPALKSVVIENDEPSEPVKTRMKLPSVAASPVRTPITPLLSSKQPVKRKHEPLSPISPSILSEKVPEIKEDKSQDMLTAIMELAENPVDSYEFEMKKPKISEVIMNCNEPLLKKIRPIQQTANGYGLFAGKWKTSPSVIESESDIKKLNPPQQAVAELKESLPTVVDNKETVASNSKCDVIVKPKIEDHRDANNSTPLGKPNISEQSEKIVSHNKYDIKSSHQKINDSIEVKSSERLDKAVAATIKAERLDDSELKNHSVSTPNQDAEVVQSSSSKISEHRKQKDSSQKTKSFEHHAKTKCIDDGKGKVSKSSENSTQKDSQKLKSSDETLKKDRKNIDNKEHKSRKDSVGSEKTSTNKDSSSAKKTKDSAHSIKKDHVNPEKSKLVKTSSNSSISSSKSSDTDIRKSTDGHAKTPHKDVDSVNNKTKIKAVGKITELVNKVPSTSKTIEGNIKSSMQSKDQSLKEIDASQKQVSSEKSRNSVHKSESLSHHSSSHKSHKDDKKIHKSSHHKKDSSQNENKHKSKSVQLHIIDGNAANAKVNADNMLNTQPFVVIEKMRIPENIRVSNNNGSLTQQKVEDNTDVSMVSNVQKVKIKSPDSGIAATTVASHKSNESSTKPHSVGHAKVKSTEKDVIKLKRKNSLTCSISMKCKKDTIPNDGVNRLPSSESGKSSEKLEVEIEKLVKPSVPSLTSRAQNKINKGLDDVSLLDNSSGRSETNAPTGNSDLDLSDVVEIDASSSKSSSKTTLKKPISESSVSRSGRGIRTRSRAHEEFVRRHNFLQCLLESMKILNNITAREKPVYVAPGVKTYPDAIPLVTVNRILGRLDSTSVCLLSNLSGAKKGSQNNFVCVTKTAGSEQSVAAPSGDAETALNNVQVSSATEKQGSNFEEVDMDIDSDDGAEGKNL